MSPSESDAQRPRHPIAVVAERTGLSPDVLRVWERRYGAVHPTRTAGGERLYSDADIHRLRLLHSATSGRRRIATVAALTDAELAKLVAADTVEVAARPARRDDEPSEAAKAAVDAAMGHVRDLDAAGLDAVLRQAALRVGIFPFLETVAAPLLARIGDEWHSGTLSVAEEHLASAVVEHLALEMTRAGAHGDGPRLLIATPAGARHVVGAALVGAAAAAEGWDVVFLGGDVPAADIGLAAESSRADAVALSVVYAERLPDLVAELRTVRARVPRHIPLLVGGRAVNEVAAELEAEGISVGSTFADLRDLLPARRPAPGGGRRR
ncbi:MAG TPA: cobalamin-dependent protein [Gemmatimonadaceae bacterium]|nr:cobalamin-dependent protein [Gemmatimonadaceae bacterium]